MNYRFPLGASLAFITGILSAGCATHPPAASVEHTATAPKPARLQGVAVPEDVQALLKELQAIYASREFDRLEALLTGDFLYQGMDGAALVAHLKSLPAWPAPVRITALRFEADGDRATLIAYAEHGEGVLAPSLQALPLNAGARIVRDHGRWRLQGNQQREEQPLYRKGEFISAQFEPVDLALYQKLLPKGMSLPKAPRVRVEMTDWQDMEPPQTPYQLASVSIRARFGQQDGWVLLTMPESDWLAVEAGRPIGFPKFVSDFSLQRVAADQWRAEVGAPARPLMRLSFDPDAKAEAAYRPTSGGSFWLPTPEGEPLRTARMNAIGAPGQFRIVHGWMSVDFGDGQPWSGLLAAGARAAAVKNDIAGGFKLVVERLESGADLADVPEDVLEFVRGYDEAILSNNLDRVMGHFSLRYLASGRSYRGQKLWVSSWLPAMDAFETRITGFKRISATHAEVEAMMIHSFGETPYRGQIGREGSRWKWLGNQQQR